LTKAMVFNGRNGQLPFHGLLMRRRDVGSGSTSAGRARDLTARKLTAKLSDRIADVRGRQ
jgi:hypothetical protein